MRTRTKRGEQALKQGTNTRMRLFVDDEFVDSLSILGEHFRTEHTVLRSDGKSVNGPGVCFVRSLVFFFFFF